MQRAETKVRDDLLSRFRREQTQHNLEAVSAAINDWLQGFDDPLGLHRTQLEAVESVLTVAADDLLTNLKEIDVEKLDLAEVYDQCRDYDEAAIWLQRLWEYLKEKFEQRNEHSGNEGQALLLKAADEVVWSCYHEVLKRANHEHGAVPLTYIEPEYSPATVQTDQPLPIQLMLNAELDFLDACLQSLPIPVLRLPPTCIESPWWLAYVAHEVGHHVQNDLELVSYFRQGMTNAAVAENFSEEEAVETWGNWGEEIFADIFSIMLMGPWAVRAMTEAEVGTPARMVQRKTTYPAPVIRLALMEECAKRLGLINTSKALFGLDLKKIADEDPSTKNDYEVIEGAVTFALGPLPGDYGSLQNLCLFKKDVFDEGEAIDLWSYALSADELSLSTTTMSKLETARQVVCGSLRAWSNLSHIEDEETRQAKRKKLRTHTIEALLKSGPRETRADVLPDGAQPVEKGKALASLLREARERREKAKGGGSSAVPN